MTTVPNPASHPQATAAEKDPQQVALLRHALSRGAGVVAALLADYPNATDARLAARAWLRTVEAHRIASGLEATADRLRALANGGSR